ncbi:hypothetical protein [Paracoccus tegillarcae]|nr:hypothetical protein [Paracoccus tegillarcae]
MKTGSRLLCGTAFLTLVAAGALAQPVSEPACDLVDGALPADCQRPNGTTAVNMPTGENTEWDEGVVAAPGGFQIVIDGEPVIGDARVEDVIRKTDVALEEAKVQVRFDGLGARPRLDLQRSDASLGLDPGAPVTFTSQLNYPAYVTRGEVRIIDRASGGLGGRLLAVVPIDPNGQTNIALPEGDRLVAVHRVYDSQGRFDETVDIPLTMIDDRGLSGDVEEGTDAASRRGIPIRGGAVTVSGESVAPGSVVTTLGETVQPSPDGGFVLQRILSTGEHAVDVQINGPAQQLGYSRDIEIPRRDLFYTALVDATLGVNKQDGDSDTYTRGRLAFYANGYDDRGIEYTFAADTSDADIQDLFESFDDKDPSSLLRRIDPNEYYPVYGDGSTMVEDAPTQGKFYARIEKDRNYAVWGNSQAELKNTEFLRNERVLYGANVHWESQQQTSFGEPRAQATLYAAQPDNLPQRDVLRGTGGSVYFLSRQDITRGSEVITVELRDPVTGRVIDRRRLVPGTDYEVNYLQGSIRLAVPLSSSSGEGVVVTSPGGSTELNLVAQYEYTPVGGTVSGASVGGRFESWVTDSLRVGVSGQREETGIADQSAYGADIRYRLGENSYVEAEYAKSEGPGFGYRSSTDGGLIYDSTAPLTGNGHATRIETELDLAELGAGRNGTVSAYYQRRTEGFSSLDYITSSAERLWGFDVEVEASDRLTWGAYYDDFRNDRDQRNSEGGVQAIYKQDAVNEWAFGLEHVRRDSATETGNRTDAALRYNRQVNDSLSVSVLAQATLSNEGLSRNNRFGLGVEKDFGNGWTVNAEASDGTLGFGADILASYERADNSSLYFGYEVDPDAYDIRRSGTALSDNRGRFVFGGRRQVNDNTSFYGENTYDIFGNRDSLTSTYGIDYKPTQFLTYSVGLDVGQIRDDVSGDFKRHALSLGANYEDEQLTASGRVEYRRERGDDDLTARDRDADTILLTANATYKLDESRTLLAYLDYADTDTDETSIRDGRLTDFVLGYAVRPIDNDRFNMLFKYRYYYDRYGQTVDGTDQRGPLQKSHIFTVDAEYDLNQQWSIGGKIGGRLSETASGPTGGFRQNDAWLVVANARYHVVHNWDLLVEARALKLDQADTTDMGLLAAGYRHFGNNMKVGVGYNFGSFSDDLSDMTDDDKGLFINAIAKF